MDGERKDSLKKKRKKKGGAGKKILNSHNRVVLQTKPTPGIPKEGQLADLPAKCTRVTGEGKKKGEGER